jgi:hypothetical protein
MVELQNQDKAIIDLQRMVNSIQTTEGKLRTITKNLDSYTIEFEALMPNQCPLCNQEVK